MMDRVSTDPGRVLVVPEGEEMQSYYATLYRADNPTQEGTPLNKATFLTDATAALYDAFGLDEGGYPVWSQPTGAHDAYNTGDIVNYNGTLYKSLIDGNVWSPEAYPAGWEAVEA